MTYEPIASAEDLARCEAEPIHIPGAIQPHGFLLVVRASRGDIVQASANVDEWLGSDVEDLLGAKLADVLGAEGAHEVLAAAAVLDDARGVGAVELSVHGRVLDGIVHRQDDLVLLEGEERLPPPATREALLGRAVSHLQAATDLESVLTAAVQEVRALSGFDRVMVYRFDEEGHGAVIAEATAPGLDPYLGLHYPASDIPRQARELYRRNWLRLIPDGQYQPVPLVPPVRVDDGRPLDLSLCGLRSVSPVHREYLRNMGVRASMSVSLLRRGELWGLLSCGHREPRYLSYELRSACETVGKLLSLQVQAFEELHERAAREALRELGDRLTAAMSAAEGPVFKGLLSDPSALLDMAGAAGAAVVCGDDVWTVGDAPSVEQVRALAPDVMAELREGLCSTPQLSRLHPPAVVYAERASGVLAISLPTPDVEAVLWFRPEVVQTVEWGGDPRKPVDARPGERLHPRTSFELWKEEVRGRSRPWTRAELAAATDLRRSSLEIDLARQVRRERAAVRARDDLVAVVSHDLRNPLSVIQLQTATLLRLLGNQEDDTSQRMRAAVNRTQSSVERMQTLLRDLLDLARIEAGRFEVAPSPRDPLSLVDDALDIMLPLAAQRKQRVERVGEATKLVLADPDRVFQVLANLLSNAIKLAPEGSHVRVLVEEHDDAVELAVKDEGPGIPQEMLPKLFDRYWQSPDRQGGGAGLGLFIARGIVEAHRGDIWVESEVGVGSTFHFTLPLAGGPPA